MARKIISPKGRPPGLTEDNMALIIDAVPKVVVQSLIADKAMVPRTCLNDWLTWGKADLEIGKDSIYAQLSRKYQKARSDYAEDLISRVRAGLTNYGAITWLLEKGFRAQFGADAEEIRELRAMFEQFKPLLDKKE